MIPISAKGRIDTNYVCMLVYMYVNCGFNLDTVRYKLVLI